MWIITSIFIASVLLHLKHLKDGDVNWWFHCSTVWNWEILTWEFPPAVQVFSPKGVGKSDGRGSHVVHLPINHCDPNSPRWTNSPVFSTSILMNHELLIKDHSPSLTIHQPFLIIINSSIMVPTESSAHHWSTSTQRKHHKLNHGVMTLTLNHKLITSCCHYD